MESENRLGQGGEQLDWADITRRTARRAQELRDENVRTLGRLARVLRERQDMTREQVARKSRLHPGWVAMLEWELLGERDLSRVRLRRLGTALRVPMPHLDIALAEATRINYDQLPERAHPIRPGVRITR